MAKKRVEPDFNAETTDDYIAWCNECERFVAESGSIEELCEEANKHILASGCEGQSILMHKLGNKIDLDVIETVFPKKS